MATSLLLADDSPTIAKILQLALQSEQYEIRAVLTAEEALRELKDNTPFFFLCDLSLPGKNGYEFARLIKSDTRLSKIRVVLLASAFEPVDEQMYQGCGADGLVKKPFDPSELRAKLRQIHDMPPKLSETSKVTGSLSGFTVSAPDPTPVGVQAPAAEEGALSLGSEIPPAAPSASSEGGLSLSASTDEATDLSALLTGNANPGADADSILAGLLGGGETPAAPSAAPQVPPPAPKAAAPTTPPSAPPAAPPTAAPAQKATPDLLPPAAPPSAPKSPVGEVPADQPSFPTNPSQPTFTNTTVMLDLSGLEAEPPKHEAPAGVAASFSTPAGGTAQIDTSLLGGEPVSPPPAPGAPAEENLSPNAQALAAFFAAEIGSQKPSTPPALPKAPESSPSPAPEKAATPTDDDDNGFPPQDEDFEASLTSIEWGPAKESLNEWSSQSAGDAPSTNRAEAPPPFHPSRPPSQPATRAAAQAPASVPAASRPPSSASGGFASSDSLMFDTGGSSFRFSDDYVDRITKSFTGALKEEVPQKHTPIFHTRSDDSAPAASAAPASAPAPGGFSGGTWSEADMHKIEQIVREEVQMVVREVAEKIAWEVIPELAENIIRKELDKVLKEMEPN